MSKDNVAPFPWQKNTRSKPAPVQQPSVNGGTPPQAEAAVHVTFFSDKSAKTCTTKSATLSELRGLILAANADKKEKLRWLKLARFGDERSDDDSLRHNANVLAISGIELDYDGEVMAFDTAVNTVKAARLQALLYTSPSHTDQAPRWRILLPTSRPLPPSERANLVARVNGLFGGVLAGESFTLSQSYYFGRVNNNPAHRAEIVGGDFIDSRADLDASAIFKKTSNGKIDRLPLTDVTGVRPTIPITSLEDARLGLSEDVRHMIVNATPPVSKPHLKGGKGHCFVVGALIGRGLSNAQIKEVYRLGKIAIGPLWCSRGFDGYLERVIAFCRPEPQEPVVPVDLWGKFEPPSLPTGLLPSVIEQYAIQQSELMGCDAGGLAMAALTVCAAVISDRIELQMKIHDPNWKESARIWTALVGLPSTKKSPIMRQAARTLVDLDLEMYRDHADALAEYNALPREERKINQRPQQKRLRIEDTTYEAARDLLMACPDGVLCLQDEMSGWFGAMDKYNSPRGVAKDRGFWMQSFNGGSYAFDRVGSGTGVIPNLSVSMLGGIQPDPMRKLVAEAHDDGLIQRLFTIVLKSATMGQDRPQLAVVNAYDNLVYSLHELQPPTNYGEGNLVGYLPTVLHFDDSAQDLRNRLEQKHLDLQALEAINKKLAAHIGKYDGLFGRLCVLWHCIENVDQLTNVISFDTANRVAKFLHEFLLPHAIAFYTDILGLSDEHDRLTAVAGYILAHKLERVTNRDIAHGDRTMRKLTKRDTESVFEQLDALGWVSRVPSPRPSSPPHWVVNPEAHRRFRERGEAEAKRRADARQTIREAIGALRDNGDTRKEP